MDNSNLASKIARPFVLIVERYYPDPFVFVVLLTLVTFGLALGLTDITPVESVQAWGGGMSSLLSFMAQIALTLITAHALAHTDSVDRMVRRFARMPSSEVQCYVAVVLVASAANLIAWSLGLIVGALMARRVAEEGFHRGLNLHYPLVVASAYAGLVIWHMGYSGSAPLFVATPGHQFESLIGVIPVTETIFTLKNLLAILVTVFAVAVVCPLMHPPKDEIIRLDPTKVEKSSNDDVSSAESNHRLDNSRGLSLILGLILLSYLIIWFWREGFALNLNIVNWSFVAAGLLLSRSPLHYVTLIKNAGHTVGPVLIQYPFYAAIMGLMIGSDLVGVFAGWFTELATRDSLPFYAFLSGGLINMFVPSGGGQWAVQGPIFLQAAKELGTEPAAVVMGVAYGDQWTNMIQPFWTIPLLAVAGLHMRQILGYCFVVFIVSGLTLGLSISL